MRASHSCLSVRPHRVRPLVAASSSVYGDAPIYPTTEESITPPVSPCGVTKLASEQLCPAYARPGVSELSMAALRYFSIYGPRQRPDMAFHRFLDAAYAAGPVVVFGDGEKTRDFTHVDDAVRANLMAMRAPIFVEAIDVGGGRRVTVNEVLGVIGRYSGWRLKVERVKAQAGDARHTGADGTQAEALLGYRPEVTLQDGGPGRLGGAAAGCARPHGPAKAGPRGPDRSGRPPRRRRPPAGSRGCAARW